MNDSNETTSATGDSDLEDVLRRGNQDAYRAVWIGLVAVLLRRLARDGEIDRSVLAVLGTGLAVDLASQTYRLLRRD